MTKSTDNNPPESIAAQELRLFVERVKRLNEEKKGIADDTKEEAIVLETYMAALGMI